MYVYGLSIVIPALRCQLPFSERQITISFCYDSLYIKKYTQDVSKKYQIIYRIQDVCNEFKITKKVYELFCVCPNRKNSTFSKFISTQIGKWNLNVYSWCIRVGSANVLVRKVVKLVVGSQPNDDQPQRHFVRF